MKLIRLFLIATTVTTLFWSCKKEDNSGPKLSFKTGAGYTSSNTTVARGAAFTVGIIVEKTKADMSAYIVDYSINNGAVFNSVNAPVTPAGTARFETDINLRTSTTGTEKWIFRVADVTGNLTTKELVITVQ